MADPQFGEGAMPKRQGREKRDHGPVALALSTSERRQRFVCIDGCVADAGSYEDLTRKDPTKLARLIDASDLPFQVSLDTSIE
jgi:hypothetical protein